MIIPETKKCRKCGKTKVAEEFHLKASAKDLLANICKQCRKHEHRKFYLPQKFGITEEEYIELLNKQNGVCALCGQPETTKSCGKVQALSVDHNHKTNKIRALLCNRCNAGLGNFNDDPELLRKAVKYLEDND